jgi:hypothetical protein
VIRRATWFAALTFSSTATFMVAGPSASAQGAAQQGWWTVANPGGSLPAPAPPDVPADGLLVQGGSSDASPTAYVALVYEVPAGATVGELTLRVAPGSGTTPNATPRACFLVNAFSPEQGGPIANAPAYDCSKNSTGKPSSGGDSYHFDVSALVTSGTLAVAILPASATDRIVFSKPGNDSLAVTQPVAAVPAATDGGTAADTNQPSVAAPPTSPSLETSAALPTDVAQSSLPVTSAPTGAAASIPQVAGPAPAVQSSAATAGTPTAATASRGSGGGKTGPALVALAVGGLLLAAALWAYAGRSAPPSRAPTSSPT